MYLYRRAFSPAVYAIALVFGFLLFAGSPGEALAADKFECDGVTYEILSSSEKTVALSLVAESANLVDSNGALNIPTEVVFGADAYSVVQLGTGLYWDPTHPFDAVGSSIRSIEIPSSITTLNAQAFWGLSALESVSIPRNVTSYGPYLFANCSSLTDVKWDTATEVMPGAMFFRCSALQEISLPATITTYSEFGNEFAECTSLRSVVLPSGITSIHSSMFYGCTSLESISIPEGVTEIGNAAFCGCTSLRSISFPSGIQKIGSQKRSNAGGFEQNVFQGCTSLKEVYLPKSVTYVNGASFADCSGLTTIEVEEGSGSYKSIDGVLYDASGTVLVAWPCGKSGSYTAPASLTSVDVGAFYDAGKLEHVDFASSKLGGFIGYSSFMGCRSLAEVLFSEECRLGYIAAHAFDSCSALETFQIPALTNTTSYGQYWDGYGPQWHGVVGPVSLSDGNNALSESAFANCRSLKSVVFSAGNSDGALYYHVLSPLFLNDTSLESVVFEDKQSYFMNPDGAVQNYGQKSDFWASSKIDSPDLYYAVNYYESRSAAEADGKKVTPYRRFANRLARVEYKRGTRLADIASGSVKAEDVFSETALYRSMDSDGSAPDPAAAAGHEGESGWSWAFESAYGTDATLNESVYAYPVKSNDLSGAHAESEELTSIRKQSPGHLESWLNPYSYNVDYSGFPNSGSTYNQRYKYSAYQGAYNNTSSGLESLTKWFQLDSAGVRLDGFELTGANGELLRQGEDYEVSWRSYDSALYKQHKDPLEYAQNSEPAVISEKGTYLLVLTGKGDYEGSLAMWVPVEKYSGKVDTVYRSTSAQASYTYNANTSKAPNTSAAYAVVCDASSLSSLVLGASYASLANGWVISARNARAAANSVHVATIEVAKDERRVMCIALDDGFMNASLVNTEYYGATEGISTYAELANALYESFAPSDYSRKDADVQDWGSGAVLLPLNLADYYASVAEYIYATDSAVFFMEEDGSVSDETLANLSHFSEVAIPGGPDVLSDEALAQLGSALGSGVTVTRLAAGESSPGGVSLALAKNLIEKGVSSVSQVSVVDGRDLGFVAAGISQFGFDGGITLQSDSVADSKAVFNFLNENRDEVKNVVVLAADEDGDGYADTMSSEAWKLETELSSIWSKSADEENEAALVDGDTLSYRGSTLVVTDSKEKLATVVAGTYSPTSISANDVVEGYRVEDVSSEANALSVLQSDSCYVGKKLNLETELPENTMLVLGPADVGIVSGTSLSGVMGEKIGETTVVARAIDTETSRLVMSTSFVAKVEPKDISKATIAAVPDQAYTGNVVIPTLDITDGTKKLAEGIDYEVSGNAVNAGPASVTVAGVGEYSGSAVVDFVISEHVIGADNVKISCSDYVYDGKAKVPTVAVAMGDKQLVEGADYAVVLENNISAGTALVRVSGIGNYSGTVEKAFTIAKASQALKVSKASCSKTCKAAKSGKSKGKLKSDCTVTASCAKAVKLFGISGSKTTLAFSRYKVTAVKGSKTNSSAAKGYISVTADGKIKVKKGLKRGTYTVKVKVYAKASANYKASAVKYVAVKVKVK